MNVLVAYGSKRGSTGEIAEAIGEELRAAGCTATVRAADTVLDLDGYDAVVLGGSLYMMRWHPDSRRFARRYSATLKRLPVWLFSSGPLDHSAENKEIAPVGFVAKLAAEIGARGHATFGGRLAPDASGFIAGSMAKKMAGDYRDWEGIRAWARQIAGALDLRAIA
jgi:menaquinone-dependent protoporphyrinogen oxidase